MAELPINPFESSRNIGTITQVGPATAKANLPSSLKQMVTRCLAVLPMLGFQMLSG
jgi:hypothetical protein